jgi:hypothetical protein
MGGILPTYYAILENNDPSRRVMAIVNYNNDVAEHGNGPIPHAPDRHVHEAHARGQLHDLCDDATERKAVGCEVAQGLTSGR